MMGHAVRGWIPSRSIATGCEELDLSNSGCLTFTQATLTAEDDLSNAAWTKSADTTCGDFETITASGATPTNVQVEQTITGGHTSDQGAPYTFTRLFKYVDIQWVKLEFRGTTAASMEVFIDIQNGVIGVTGALIASASISTADGSGYRLVTVVLHVNTGTVGPVVRMRPSTANTTYAAPTVGTSMKSKRYTPPGTGAVATSVISCLRLATAKSRFTRGTHTAGTNPPWMAPKDGRLVATGENGYDRKMIAALHATLAAAFQGSDLPWTVFSVVSDLKDTISKWASISHEVSMTTSYRWGTVNDGTGRFRATVNDGTTNKQADSSANYATGKQISCFTSTGTVGTHSANGAALNPSAADLDTGSMVNVDRLATCGVDSAGTQQSDQNLHHMIWFSSVLNARDQRRIRSKLAGVWRVNNVTI